MNNLGSYTTFRYRDVFISIENYNIVIRNVNWYSQQSYDLSCMKND